MNYSSFPIKFQIMREVLRNMPGKEVLEMRLVNTILNCVATRVLHAQGHVTLRICSGNVLTAFLDRMLQRLEDVPLYSAFSFFVQEIPTDVLGRFTVGIGQHVRKLTIYSGTF